MTEMNHLALDVPLEGVQLIEASAGTGKTFVLTLLMVRLIIERRLSIEQILVVTFTKAATQELREKLREKLRIASQLAAADSEALRCRDPETRLTWALISAACDRGQETLLAIRQRLQRAVLDIDLAAVFTIDAFCLRVLADDALAAGQSLEVATLLGSERELFDEVALEAWRHFCQWPDQARLMPSLWAAPAVLARQLPDLLRNELLLPSTAAPITAQATGSDADAASVATRAQLHLRASFVADLVPARAAMAAAVANKILNGNSYKHSTLAKAWQQLDMLVGSPPLSFLETQDLGRLATSALVDKTNKGHVGKTPTSPLFDAIGAWCKAVPALVEKREQQRLHLLHEVRDYARERLQAWKQLRHQLGFADLTARLNAALAGATGEALAQGLRERYRVALVDEFQDTDPQQWAIFERLYVGQPALGLFLIGDPKQAIYGFRGGDVHTYLQARHSAQGSYTLAANFRSRPRVLSAIAAIFKAGGDGAFAEPGIAFADVQPGGSIRDDDFCLAGISAPALTLWALPHTEGKHILVERARQLATQACVRCIRELLVAGRSGEALLTLKQDDARVTRGVLPRDIAVLVSDHKQATRMQQALAEAGIASVTAGRLSLFETNEARELLWLLEAICVPDDDRRLRTALATVLIGEDAAAIAALASDDARQREWLDAMQDWRERWDRHGPLPMISDRVAAAGPRLLALADGERRLGNYLQLAEVLQEASAAALGPIGLTHWLSKCIEQADDSDETQQLRLESDARRVQIMTLHKSKGLEFPLVFLPFAALPPPTGNRANLGLRRYHDGQQHVTHAKFALGDDTDAWGKAQRMADQQQRAESLRLLYVALTRAQHALWLAWGPVNGADKTALAWLLHGGSGAVPESLAATATAAALTALAASAPDAIVHEPFPYLTPVPRLSPAAQAPPPPLQAAIREMRRDWWVYSFSQLSREQSGSDERGAEDETRPRLPLVDTRFAGVRFGNALHKALETVVVARWTVGNSALPPEERATLAAALRGEGYVESDLADGIAVLAPLIVQTLTARLPEGSRLCDLPEHARCNEMEFHFALQATRVADFVGVLHAHGFIPDRLAFGARQRLEGLMTGKIDLVYEVAGRIYLLDYKSNQLPDYQPATLAKAMRESEYDLQYLLYTLAVHRWLRFRLGASYDYGRHFGGVRYLFCRGLDSDDELSPGIFASKPEQALIEALDHLFTPHLDAAA